MTPAMKLMLLGGAPFRLSSLFSAGQAGLWYGPSDMASLFQDSTGATPVTAVGQPVGKISDKSGRGNHAIQATAAARPVLAASPATLTYDGIDDGTATATFAAGTLTSNMDCFMVVRRESAAPFMAFWASAPNYVGAANSGGGASVSHGGAGAAVNYAVNGTAVAGGTATTEVQLAAAMPVGQLLILEIRNLDLSAWTDFKQSLYPGYPTNGGLGDTILCPAQTDAVRAKIRQYLASRYGVSL
jgi:hypothetical protein